MGFHVQLDLKAIEQAGNVARAAGITEDQQLAGLARLYHSVWTKKVSHASPALLCGCFGVTHAQLERLVDAEIAYGHLAQRSEEGWRIRGAKRYFRLRAALSEGGKKALAAGNLRGPKDKEQPGPKRTRSLSAQEDCFAILERLRIEHCQRLGIEPGASRNTVVNKRMNDAVDAAGIVDRILDGEPFTRWDYLTLLFEQYLLDDFGHKDKEGNVRSPPWPIELFLSAGVLKRFKDQYEGVAA